MADMMDLDSKDWDGGMFDDVFGDVPDQMKLLVFMIDSSGSMEGTFIGTVNSIMEEVLEDLEKDKSHKRIAVLSYAQDVNWVTPKPVNPEALGGWNRLRAGELSNLGAAAESLGKKLGTSGWCEEGKNGINGIFILFSDGMATDHYETGMKYLKQNPVFQKGVRLAVNFSERKDLSVLEDFAGSRDRVLNLRINEIAKAQKQILAAVNG